MLRNGLPYKMPKEQNTFTFKQSTMYYFDFYIFDLI